VDAPSVPYRKEAGPRFLGEAGNRGHDRIRDGRGLGVARQIAVAWNDQDFSIVDCTSFAVMQRLGIRRAASYDADFGVFRFGHGRRLAFDVVR
jgi:hypothetical protein